MKLQASACNFITKETMAQVFSCEFCETYKNTFSLDLTTAKHYSPQKGKFSIKDFFSKCDIWR